MNSYIPTAAKITVWICLAHFWIISCSIIYVTLEGYDKSTYSDDELDKFFVKTFSKQTNRFSRSNTKLYKEFKRRYNEIIDKSQYWKHRKKFNDISKVYLFVLSTHTTVGSYGLKLQTWKGQLFYFFTAPIGVLLYLIMCHVIVVELFEVFAYCAVTIFKRESNGWTMDERDLYEKLKVVAISAVMLMLIVFLFALMTLFNHDTYLSGLVAMLNLIMTVDSNTDFVSFQDWEHHIVAFVMSFVYFISMLSIYLLVYSVFILFRYNKLHDIVMLFRSEEDRFFDIVSDEESEYGEIRKHQQSMSYYHSPLKTYDHEQKQYLPIGITEVRMQQPQAFEISAEAMALTDDNSDVSSIKPKRRKKRKKDLSKLVIPSTKRKQSVPQIEVTQPTPSPDKKEESVSSLDSEYTNISAKEFFGK
ncbi:uncharacterized protein LOC130649289 [Hydractinia symbiolongicarpus]|uniref:uncharacterized protein LOC130649289 n=1 Tax=Hydractinia symbiolongicarpus TaxID=13093 RepID=UPI00254CF9F3|nr:uncharacterized protein LOC130649289 [Hydractinia symbiolongicarpus]